MYSANIFDVTNWFLSKGSMSHKKLQKLSYFYKAWGLALTGKDLIPGYEYEAWVHGPVNRELYEKYGVECSAALHHNKKKTNLHIHPIYSEREKLSDPVQKIATRRRYYDPEGNHLRTAKKAKDESGKVLPGYTVIEKGEVYEEHLFEKKKPVFKSKAFTNEVKEFFVELMNT